MIWVIIIAVTILVSVILAFRSMKDYRDLPASKQPLSLYLVRNRGALNTDLFQRLDQIVSVERIFKNGEDAVVIYGPTSLIQNFPELNLLELEDLLESSVKIDDVFAWGIQPKSGAVQKMGDIKRVNFWKELQLDEDQMVFWQVVCTPDGGVFQVTMRGIIVDPEPQKRVILSKLIDQKLQQETGLIREERKETTTHYFNAFKKRTLIPKEVSKFTLNADEILNILGL